MLQYQIICYQINIFIYYSQMNKTGRSKRKRMLNFSFCFPYLSSLSRVIGQSFSKQKAKSKKKRYLSAKKMGQGKFTEAYTHQHQQQFSSQKIEIQSKKCKARSFIKQEDKELVDPSEKLSGTIQIKKQTRPFALTEMVQFDVNELVRRKPYVSKQGQKNIDIVNYQSVLSNNFQIPGVSFKKAEGVSLKHRYQTINHLHQQSQNLYNSKVIQRAFSKNSSSKWKQRRLINIQYIIKSRCKDFQGTMAQYYQRTSNKKTSFIFVFDSKDTWMKRVLLQRNWAQNTNKDSRAFHLLWTYKYPKQISLYSEQLINHYPQSIKLTTKAGLHAMLKQYNLSHLQPKTYELDKERKKFLAQYDKISFIRDVKEVMLLVQFEQQTIYVQQTQLKGKLQDFLKLSMQNQEEEIFQRQIKYLLSKCFDFLQHSNSFQYKGCNSVSIKKAIMQRQKFYPTHLLMFSLLREFLQFIEKSDQIKNLKEGGFNNIWIVKPQFSSKGAGMFLSNDSSLISRQGNRLVQKYIENVLILQEFKNRKLDLRVWVLVVGGKNCKIYYNQQFYGRFCFQTYSLDQKCLKNNAIHLTNYSVSKCSYGQANSKTTSVLFSKQFFSEIQKQYKISYQQIFYSKLNKILHQLFIIFQKQVCLQAQQSNFQLFGLDLLIDYKLDIHLLQINLSAQCQERHQKLTQMLQQMGEGLLNIIEGKEDLKKWKLIQ